MAVNTPDHTLKGAVVNATESTLGWVDERFPLTKMYKEHLAEYYAPKNFNFWYYFGSLAMLVFVIQIVSGIWLAMYYKPDAANAFASVEFIMREVEWGWVIRYMHSTGASFFFIVVYLHMFRALQYGSYKAPRELIWLIGMGIYGALMAEAFMGYLLPWGQMSYWGAQVIISLFGALPVVGEPLAQWIRGDFVVSDATLNRFFSLHVVALPFVIAGLIGAHIVALHEVGSNNPDGIDIKKTKDSAGKPVDGIPFHPYYTVKDIYGASIFLFLFAAVVFYMPELGGWFLEHANFEPANALSTPEHILPVWYFTPYYAILRAIPDKLIGVIGMGLAVGILFVLPWLDRHPINSIRYRSVLTKAAVYVFAVNFIFLGWLGVQPATQLLSEIGLRMSELYFSFFMMLWLYSKPRAASTHWSVFGVVILALLLIDGARSASVPLSLLFTSLAIPVVYHVIFTLGPVLVPGLARDGVEPARVTA